MFYVQDSPTRICVVSIHSLIDTFSQSTKKIKVNDLTTKIEPILGTKIDIENKFPSPDDEDDEEEQLAHKKEDDDQVRVEMKMKKFI